MRPYVENRLIHKRCQADRATRVISENQKPGREGPHTTERHAINGGTHGMLANAEVKVTSSMVPKMATGLEVPAIQRPDGSWY
jgi:hypothetical protein